MATIVITSSGTLGDHLPYIALGECLQARGHKVRMAISKPMHPYAVKAGLEVVCCGQPLGQQEAQDHAKDWNHLISYSADQENYWKLCLSIQREIPQDFQDLLSACVDADLLICGLQQYILGAMVEEKIGIAWMGVSVTPFFMCYKDADEMSMKPDPFLPLVNEIRQNQGLKYLTPEGWIEYMKPKRGILASSPHFCQLTSGNSDYKQTGFWFYEDPEWKDWQPDDQLREFMESEPKPLVLSFSSLPLENTQSVLEVHIRAAWQLGRRILVQQGWANFNEELLPGDCDRESVMFAGFMPQDWLFSHAAALIHHGGVGTTARALRNNCPMLVEPYGNDQFFNAQRVLALKVGAAMHPEKLTVDGLARVLEAKVLTDETKQNTQVIGGKIREENALNLAGNLIESWLS